MIAIKICGLRDPDTMAAALHSGADLVGLVLVPASPRHVAMATAMELAEQARGRALITVLLVDPDDATLELVRDAIGPDLLQLHGRETPERLREVAALTDIPVMKAVGIATEADLRLIGPYAATGARILLDAKPPKDAAYPGGHGRPFDWSILAGLDPGQTFMLSGGLTPGNVAEAIATLGSYGLRLAGVDVSSGVESAPGVKDAEKITRFIAAARAAAR